MTALDENFKRLYDALAHAVFTLHLQKGRLSRDEMYCLLNVLDMTLPGMEDQGLVQVLREWQEGHPNPEIDEIIKATLLGTDFTKPASLASTTGTIRELIRYNKDLGETRVDDEPPSGEPTGD